MKNKQELDVGEIEEDEQVDQEEEENDEEDDQEEDEEEDEEEEGGGFVKMDLQELILKQMMEGKYPIDDDQLENQDSEEKVGFDEMKSMMIASSLFQQQDQDQDQNGEEEEEEEEIDIEDEDSIKKSIMEAIQKEMGLMAGGGEEEELGEEEDGGLNSVIN